MAAAPAAARAAIAIRRSKPTMPVTARSVIARPTTARTATTKTIAAPATTRRLNGGASASPAGRAPVVRAIASPTTPTAAIASPTRIIPSPGGPAATRRPSRAPRGASISRSRSLRVIVQIAHALNPA